MRQRLRTPEPKCIYSTNPIELSGRKQLQIATNTLKQERIRDERRQSNKTRQVTKVECKYPGQSKRLERFKGSNNSEDVHELIIGF